MEIAYQGAEATRRPRCKHSVAYKTKVAFASIEGDKRLAALVEKFDVQH